MTHTANAVLRAAAYSASHPSLTAQNGGDNNHKKGFVQAGEIFSHLVRGILVTNRTINANDLRTLIFTDYREQIGKMTAQPFVVRVDGVDYRIRQVFVSRHSSLGKTHATVSMMNLQSGEVSGHDVPVRQFYQIK